MKVQQSGATQVKKSVEKWERVIKDGKPKNTIFMARTRSPSVPSLNKSPSSSNIAPSKATTKADSSQSLPHYGGFQMSSNQASPQQTEQSSSYENVPNEKIVSKVVPKVTAVPSTSSPQQQDETQSSYENVPYTPQTNSTPSKMLQPSSSAPSLLRPHAATTHNSTQDKSHSNSNGNIQLNQNNSMYFTPMPSTLQSTTLQSTTPTTNGSTKSATSAGNGTTKATKKRVGDYIDYEELAAYDYGENSLNSLPNYAEPPAKTSTESLYAPQEEIPLIPPEPKKISAKLREEPSCALCPMTDGWNTVFQHHVQRVYETNFGDAKAWFAAAQIAREFTDTAALYAKIIISELCLPDEEKTIKPINIGGVAGGQKYKYKGILFKFALDTEVIPNFWMYGGADGPNDHCAMKAAKSELKGIEAHSALKIPGLWHPLMALIDYKGFRVTAISVLPLTHDSLKYGSNDGGATMHDDDPELSEKMKSASLALNLKGHWTGIKEQKYIYGPGDLEAHLGSDGRYYVLDFGRLYPPEDPSFRKDPNKRSVYYAFLRGELVKKSPVPLCSDAFTSWNSDKDIEQRKINNEEVTNITRKLYDEIIPEFARQLDNTSHEIVYPEYGFDSSMFKKVVKVLRFFSADKLHTAGINWRHLGYIRKHSHSPAVRKLLLEIAIARTVKDEVKETMRFKMRQCQVPSDEPFKNAVVEFLNVLIGKSKDSEPFWKEEIKRSLQQKYIEFLTDDELDLEKNLKDKVDLRVIIVALCKYTSIEINKLALQHLMMGCCAFEFVRADIKEIGCKLTQMGMIESAEAIGLYLEATDKAAQSKNRIQCIRQLKAASKHFRLCHEAAPTCTFALSSWGCATAQLAALECQQEVKLKHYNSAWSKFSLALSYKTLQPLVLTLYAKKLRMYGEDFGVDVSKEAEEKEEEAKRDQSFVNQFVQAISSRF